MCSKIEIQSMIKNASGIEMELIYIPKIMSKQTEEEIDSETTIENNHMGLNYTDAEFITSLYEWIRAGKHLTIGQIKAARKALPKYWKQYMEMMK